MTDLNKERELELFNAFVAKELPELFEKHSNGNYFSKIIYDSMLGAWLGAKAQAVPDTHVVVPKVPTEKMLKRGNRLALSDSQYRYDAASIYEVMLEASEFGAEG